MNVRRLIQTLAFSILFSTNLTAVAQSKYEYKSDWTLDWEENYEAQALLGAVKYKDMKFEESSEDGTVTTRTDLSLIPQLGGAWSTIPIGEHIQYGLECSFLLGFQVDRVSARGGGSGLYVKVESSMWTFDLAGGGYVNVFLGDNVRLYGGAGPLIMYADYRVEREEESAGGDETYTDTESVFGVGVYARTGVEFRVHQRGLLGVGARGTWNSADFSDAGGSSEVKGIAGFITYTVGL